MCFWQNKVEKAFGAFRFLTEYGLSAKQNLRPPDVERIFTKDNIGIEVHYYSGVDSEFKKGMFVDIVILVNGNRCNLMKADNIFGDEMLQVLKTDIDAVKPLAQIPVYADFIKTHIDKILSLG